MIHRSDDDPELQDEEETRSWWQFGNATPSEPGEPWYGPNKGPEIATALIIYAIVICLIALAIMGVYWIGTKVF